MVRVLYNNFRTGTVNVQRTLLTEDRLAANIVSTEYFFSNLLPPAPEGVSSLINDIVEMLIKKGHLSHAKKGALCWRRFDSKKKEDDYFLALRDIFRDIVQLINIRLHITNTHTYLSYPSLAPYSDRNEHMRPDGVFMKGLDGTDGNDQYNWYDIACVGEFKKSSKEGHVVDNISKVFYGMHQMLSTDVARRFALGFAVESTTMSLWHASRTALLKCYFNYNEDPIQLIRFLISIAFAKPNGQETGWDPTVTPMGINEREEMQYRYDVKGTDYDTKEKLADYATNSMKGKGSRVYMVEEKIEGTGKTTKIRRVLKDCWRDSDRPSESEIVVHMLDDIEAACGLAGRKCVEEHIVEIKDEVVVEVDGEEDDTTNVIMRGAVPHVERQEMLVKEEGSKQYCYRSIGPMQSLNTDGKKARKPRARMQPQAEPELMRRLKHCRVVYKHYATPIQELTKLSEVVEALLGVTQALYYIHKAGWVHRDISAGNIYWYKGRGLLSDFEYAKKIGTAAEHEVKTGTIAFMAYEAIKRKFATVKIRRKAPVQPVFFHNPLHDMESVFWVYVFNLLDVETQEEDAWEEISVTLFSGLESTTGSRKLFVFGDSDQMENYDILLGDDQEKLLTITLSLRDELVKWYKESEATLPSRPVDEEKFVGPQKPFEGIWKEFLIYLRKTEVPLVRVTSKRRAEAELSREEPKRNKHEHSLSADEGEGIEPV